MSVDNAAFDKNEELDMDKTRVEGRALDALAQPNDLQPQGTKIQRSVV